MLFTCLFAIFKGQKTVLIRKIHAVVMTTTPAHLGASTASFVWDNMQQLEKNMCSSLAKRRMERCDVSPQGQGPFMSVHRRFKPNLPGGLGFVTGADFAASKGQGHAAARWHLTAVCSNVHTCIPSMYTYCCEHYIYIRPYSVRGRDSADAKTMRRRSSRFRSQCGHRATLGSFLCASWS